MVEFDKSMCPICGAWSRRSCDMEEELGVCPWEESQPDPDILRDDRNERRRIEKEEPFADD